MESQIAGDLSGFDRLLEMEMALPERLELLAVLVLKNSHTFVSFISQNTATFSQWRCKKGVPHLNEKPFFPITYKSIRRNSVQGHPTNCLATIPPGCLFHQKQGNYEKLPWSREASWEMKTVYKVTIAVNWMIVLSKNSCDEALTTSLMISEHEALRW